MKYTVKLYPRAYRDLDEIYSYIAVNLTEPVTANKLIDSLEEAIFSLEQFPERGSIRRVGAYANQDYSQIFVKNYMHFNIFQNTNQYDLKIFLWKVTNFAN